MVYKGHRGHNTHWYGHNSSLNKQFCNTHYWYLTYASEINNEVHTSVSLSNLVFVYFYSVPFCLCIRRPDETTTLLSDIHKATFCNWSFVFVFSKNIRNGRFKKKILCIIEAFPLEIEFGCDMKKWLHFILKTLSGGIALVAASCKVGIFFFKVSTYI